jgi:hypothetical protein
MVARVFHIRTPKLFALSINSTPFPNTLQEDVVPSHLVTRSFPSLRYLDTWGLCLPSRVVNRSIPSLNIRSIEKLFITLGNSDRATDILPILDGCPNLRVLHICNYRPGKRGTPLQLSKSSAEEFWYYSTQSHFLPPEIFASMPNLRRLHLTDKTAEIIIETGTCQRRNGEVLSGLLRNESTGALPCPHLAELVLDQVSLHTDTLLRLLAQRDLTSLDQSRLKDPSFPTTSLKLTWKSPRKDFPRIERMGYEQFLEEVDELMEFEDGDSILFAPPTIDDRSDISGAKSELEDGSTSESETAGEAADAVEELNQGLELSF